MATLKIFCDSASAKPEDLTKIQDILKTSPALISQIDEDGRTAFHWACASGNLQIAKFLHQQQPNLSTNSDEAQWTPLHSASSAGHYDVVSFLISASVDLSSQTSTGGTPLHYAASKGHVDVVRILLNAGADPNIIDKNGYTPIGKAVATNKEEVVEFMLKRGVNVNMKENVTGDNILHVSVNNHSLEIGAMLFRAKPSLAAESNAMGQTPADLASTAELLEWKSIKEGTSSEN